jgi:peroxiredoxin
MYRLADSFAAVLDTMRQGVMRLSTLALILAMTISSVYADPEGLTALTTPRQVSDFKLQDTQGKTHTLGDYRGKVLIVNFWASWCSPCIKEMPSLQRAWEQLNQETIQVLAVNVGETRQEIDSFTKTQPLSFPLLLDTDMNLTTAWSVKGLPTTYILDPSGQIVFQVIGDLAWDDQTVLQQVRALQKVTRTP